MLFVKLSEQLQSTTTSDVGNGPAELNSTIYPAILDPPEFLLLSGRTHLAWLVGQNEARASSSGALLRVCSKYRPSHVLAQIWVGIVKKGLFRCIVRWRWI